jgi:DNA-binding helix-hairpin-helix protein with protein kinase domain
MPGYCVKIFKPGSRLRLDGNVPKLKKLITYSAEIGNDAALPRYLVSETSHSKPIGFVMSEVEGSEIHNLYGILTRKSLFPHGDFRFLIEVARNAAIATDRLHKKRIVIGDVSGRNLMVRENGTVCWIDADSFMIGSPDFDTICDLATPDWTPPELQANRHSRIPRTPVHDTFGLAVIIFQLLMLGRHPFQGRFTGVGDTPEIATSISKRWYVHAGYSAIPFRPTIGTPSIEHLGDEIRELFIKAFIVDDISQRPSAARWVPALELVAKNLQKCSQLETHFHFRGFRKCPWCAVMPDLGHVDPFSGSGAAPSRKGIAGLLEREATAACNELCTVPVYPNLIFTPTAVKQPHTWVMPKPSGLVGFFAPQASIRHQVAAMKGRIEKQISVNLVSLKSNLEQQGSLLRQVESGRLKLEELAKRARVAFKTINLRASVESEYRRKLLENQKQMHLARRRLKVGDVSGIGVGKISQLNGHGIITAADINFRAIIRLSGFGQISASGLLEWQREIERSFTPQVVADDPQQLDLLAMEVLKAKKVELQKEQREIKSHIDQILKQATQAAGEAVGLQEVIDVAHANLLAIKTAVPELS